MSRWVLRLLAVFLCGLVCASVLSAESQDSRASDLRAFVVNEKEAAHASSRLATVARDPAFLERTDQFKEHSTEPAYQRAREDSLLLAQRAAPRLLARTEESGLVTSLWPQDGSFRFWRFEKSLDILGWVPLTLPQRIDDRRGAIVLWLIPRADRETPMAKMWAQRDVEDQAIWLTDLVKLGLGVDLYDVEEIEQEQRTREQRGVPAFRAQIDVKADAYQVEVLILDRFLQLKVDILSDRQKERRMRTPTKIPANAAAEPVGVDLNMLRVVDEARESAEAMAKLNEHIPDEPAFITDHEVVRLMYVCGDARRLDSAHLLIQCLVFSFDPAQFDEALEKEHLLPAVPFMKEYFGDEIAPLLFIEAMEAREAWMLQRIAFATQIVCSQECIDRMIRVFSLNDSPNENAKAFLELLSRRDIDIEADLPTKRELDRVDDAVDRLKNRQ
ncbi:MAG: hypothetical protein JW889_00860 [Verrucomicrobia bacterium]|nr:hypothetical protein [Verrucomicrobiota bacterium]